MRRYTESNEWVEQVEEYTFKVGVTQEAIEQLGEIVHIHLPEEGTKVIQNQEIIVLESTKAAIDGYSPLTGTVESVNRALQENPQLLNEDANQGGWLFTIAVESLQEWNALKRQETHITHSE